MNYFNGVDVLYIVQSMFTTSVHAHQSPSDKPWRCFLIGKWEVAVHAIWVAVRSSDRMVEDYSFAPFQEPHAHEPRSSAVAIPDFMDGDNREQEIVDEDDDENEGNDDETNDNDCDGKSIQNLGYVAKQPRRILACESVACTIRSVEIQGKKSIQL